MGDPHPAASTESRPPGVRAKGASGTPGPPGVRTKGVPQVTRDGRT
jgi:hypothetical protein